MSLVHCEWDEWVQGECDKDCGGGMQTNTRVPKIDAQHGGEKCPGNATIDVSCNVHECPGKLIVKLLSYKKINISITIFFIHC